MALTGTVFVTEKKAGLLERNCVAGVHTIEMMLSYMAIKMVIIAMQSVVVIVMLIYVFKFTFKGPLIIATILLMIQGFCGISFGRI